MNERYEPQPPTENEPLDPAEMYALLTNQQRSIESQMGAFVPALMGTWGLAWLLGFGALWLIDGLQPGFGLPLPLAVWAFAIFMVIGFGASAWLGIRSGRGIRASTASAFTGTVYGITWSVGLVALAVFGGGLAYNGLTPELANYFYPSAYVLFVGIMYLMAGAIWRAVPSVVIGGWLIFIAVAAPFFAYPLHYLFFAIAGGGVFLALTPMSFLYRRKVRTLVSEGGGHNA